MRILLAICLALAAAWAGYWFIGSSALKSGLVGWVDARRADGWVAEYTDLSVQGFPSRFDTTFTDLRLVDPVSGLGWQAPFFQLLTLSYTPNHVIAVWPHEQRVTVPEGAYTLTSADMRASLVITPGPELAPERSTLTAKALSLADPAGDAVSAAALRLAAQRVDGPDSNARYHLGLAAEDIAPPAALLTQMDAKGAAPRVIDSVIADITVEFTAPWDRFAVEEARPQPTRVMVTRIAATWVAMTLEASGTLDVDASGTPEGTITARARGWREMLDMAGSAGALSADMAQMAEKALSAMAGDDKTLEVPLRLSDGRVWLGPLPIAAAPVLRLQ